MEEKKRFWLIRLFKWCGDRFKDVFYGVGNTHLDHGRLMAFIAMNTLIAAAIWNAILHQAIDLGPTGLGGGLAGILTAAVVYMFKDRQNGGGS